MIRAARRRMRLPELDADAVPRVALLGVALSGLALALVAAVFVVVVVGLSHKADRADLRAVSAEQRATASDAKASAVKLSVCRLSFRQQPNAPGIAPPSTSRGIDLAPYWQDVFGALACDHLPRADLTRPPGGTK